MSQKAKKKRVIFYTEAFKSKVVQEVLSGKLSKKQATDIYGISGGSTILYWIRQSQGLKGNIKPIKTFANFAEMKQNAQDKKLEQENKELKELLRIAELRADLWQHAIEVAEKKLDIDIVKKFGAQQLTPFKNNGQKKK
jgi:transposase-like protein